MARRAAVPCIFLGKTDENSREIVALRKEVVQIRSDLIFSKSRVFETIQHIVLHEDGGLLNTLMTRPLPQY